MAVHLTCDHDRRKLSPDEATTLRVSGPLKSMIGAGTLHLSKPAAASLARWLGYPVDRPDVGRVPGPEPVVGPGPDRAA